MLTWGGGLPQSGGTLTGPLTIDTSSCSALSIDSDSTGCSTGLLRIRHDIASVLAGTHVGMSIDVSTNVTPGSQTVTGLSITMPAANTSSSKALAIASTQIDGVIFDLTFTGTAANGVNCFQLDASSTNITGICDGITTFLGANVAAGSRCARFDFRATAGTTNGIIHAHVGSSTTLAGAITGQLINLTTNVTHNGQVITGLDIRTAATTAAAAAGQGALVINSDATLARVIDIDCANTSGTLGIIRYGAAVSWSAASTIGLNIDLTTNVTPGAIGATGLKIAIAATTKADTAAEGAIAINSDATAARVLDLDIANTSGTPVLLRYGSAATMAATTTAFSVDQSTNITNAAQQMVAFAATQLLSSTNVSGQQIVKGTSSTGATCGWGWWEELLVLSTSGATTNTTNTIPANSWIFCVLTYTTVAIAGVNSTAMQVGDASTAARFGTTGTLTQGTTVVGMTHLQAAINSATTGAVVTAATSVRITLAGGADNTPSAGTVRIVPIFFTFTALTS